MAGRSINLVVLSGNIARDAQTKFTTGGAAVTNFSIATNERYKDKDSGEWKDLVDFHNIVLWRSENLANFLTKGKEVTVTGKLKTRNYENKEGSRVYVTEVVAEEVVLHGGGQKSDSGDRPVSAPRAAGVGRPLSGGSATQGSVNEMVDDSEIPF